MIEKLYGNIPSYGKSYITENFDEINKIVKENEQLKQELIELKKWEKYVGDVKREDLDKVFKMSIYEITEAFAYYKKRIKELSE